MATRYIQGNNDIQGSNDGATPGAGYIGEVKESGNGGGWQTISSIAGAGNYFQTMTLAGGGTNTITLGPGVWLIELHGALYNGGSSITTITNIGFGISTDSGASSFSDWTELGLASDNSSWIPAYDLVGAGDRAGANSIRIVRTLSAASTTYYPKIRIATSGALSTLKYRFRLRAIRIA